MNTEEAAAYYITSHGITEDVEEKERAFISGFNNEAYSGPYHFIWLDGWNGNDNGCMTEFI